MCCHVYFDFAKSKTADNQVYSYCLLVRKYLSCSKFDGSNCNVFYEVTLEKLDVTDKSTVLKQMSEFCVSTPRNHNSSVSTMLLLLTSTKHLFGST